MPRGISRWSVRIGEKYGVVWGWLAFWGVIAGALALGCGLGALLIHR